METNNKIKIAQWNCRGLGGKSFEIPSISLEHDILLLSETKLNENIKYGISGMVMIRENRSEHGGGTPLVSKEGSFMKK
uniref:Endonuclease/exonuclease/phosphatase domain-containing protein n=1 Tax=Bracon brevicornis TaxID=1563983 RepID=A0A6V7KDL0_9HYME